MNKLLRQATVWRRTGEKHRKKDGELHPEDEISIPESATKAKKQRRKKGSVFKACIWWRRAGNSNEGDTDEEFPYVMTEKSPVEPPDKNMDKKCLRREKEERNALESDTKPKRMDETQQDIFSASSSDSRVIEEGELERIKKVEQDNLLVTPNFMMEADEPAESKMRPAVFLDDEDLKRCSGKTMKKFYGGKEWKPQLIPLKEMACGRDTYTVFKAFGKLIAAIVSPEKEYGNHHLNILRCALRIFVRTHSTPRASVLPELQRCLSYLSWTDSGKLISSEHPTSLPAAFQQLLGKIFNRTGHEELRFSVRRASALRQQICTVPMPLGKDKSFTQNMLRENSCHNQFLPFCSRTTEETSMMRLCQKPVTEHNRFILGVTEEMPGMVKVMECGYSLRGSFSKQNSLLLYQRAPLPSYINVIGRRVQWSKEWWQSTPQKGLGVFLLMSPNIIEVLICTAHKSTDASLGIVQLESREDCSEQRIVNKPNSRTFRHCEPNEMTDDSLTSPLKTKYMEKEIELLKERLYILEQEYCQLKNANTNLRLENQRLCALLQKGKQKEEIRQNEGISNKDSENSCDELCKVSNISEASHAKDSDLVREDVKFSDKKWKQLGKSCEIGSSVASRQTQTMSKRSSKAERNEPIENMDNNDFATSRSSVISSNDHKKCKRRRKKSSLPKERKYDEVREYPTRVFRRRKAPSGTPFPAVSC